MLGMGWMISTFSVFAVIIIIPIHNWGPSIIKELQKVQKMALFVYAIAQAIA
jgi:hypothetical protein